MFRIGDNIVYPMHGAGTIDSIEEKEILGEKLQYYVIKMPGEVKVMVPTSKAESLGVRGIIDETEMSQNWNKRYRDNLDKMKTGDIYQVADVVRNLTFQQKEKGTLSTGEKKMLSNARLILVSELALAEKTPQDEVERLIDNKIEMSYKEYRVPTEATIDLQKSAVTKFIPFDNGTTTV